MQDKNNKLIVIVMATLVSAISLACIFKPVDKYSDAERRQLATFPSLSINSILKTSYMKDFEDAALDQFIFRDKFRALKSFSELFIFNKEDVNKLYFKDGYISKLEYPMNLKDLDYATNKFQQINNKYLSDGKHNLYFSIIPDKNYFLANDKLKLDYEEFINHAINNLSNMQYIDIKDVLSLDDYYYSDTHWRQEKLVKVAKIFANDLNININEDYEEVLVSDDFKGVFVGQIALDLAKDKLIYLDHPDFKDYVVSRNDGRGDKIIPLYNLDKVNDKDPYEMFVGGNSSIINIENPHADNDRELIIFRDSFTASLVPLIASGYAKTTLIDIRYINSALLEDYVEFNDQDVLFLYSTLLLNNSKALK